MKKADTIRVTGYCFFPRIGLMYRLFTHYHIQNKQAGKPMTQQIYADLHNHTTASDGDLTPEEMVRQAHLKGIKAIGITDHDTLTGLSEALAAGEKYQVTVIPGVEVSVRFKRPYFTGTLHLLCYFDKQLLSSETFKNDFNDILKLGRGEQLVRARIKEINRFFGPGTDQPLLHRPMQYEDIANLSSNATRRHFAIALETIFNLPDRETINSVIGNSSIAYLPSGIDLSSITAVIQQYDIVAALAHPAAGSFPGEGHYKEVLPAFEVVEKIFPEFMDAGIKGLEIYYPGHTDHYINLLKDMALKYHLVVTGGSDCHDAVDRPFGVTGISEPDFRTFSQAVSYSDVSGQL